MASIKVHDLNPVAGAELFRDSESFLNELTDEELGVQGGRQASTFSFTISITYSYSVSWTRTWTY